MHTFKVGDRVIALADKPKGLTGTVVVAADDWLTVDFAPWSEGWAMSDDENTCWALSPTRIRIAEPAKPQEYIVIAADGAASKPFKHPSHRAAEVESDRLAVLRPGIKFTVYQAVSSVFAPKPTPVREAF